MEFPEHKRLIDLLPGYLQEYREFREILDTEQIELDSIHLRISDLLSDTFTETATEAGIEHREKMYGIIPREGASLEERRLAVKAKESRALPYTIRQYRDMLLTMCGDGNYKVDLDAGNYAIDVKVRASAREDPQALLDSVDDMTMQVLPANMVYNSALFERHSGSLKTYYGAAVCVRKHYDVEVV